MTLGSGDAGAVDVDAGVMNDGVELSVGVRLFGDASDVGRVREIAHDDTRGVRSDGVEIHRTPLRSGVEHDVVTLFEE
jgi:hypothetical protein